MTKRGRVDLHTHTTASDGTEKPADNVRYAYEKKLQAIAITDHDIVSGLDEALEEGKKLGLEVIPGIEISTMFQGQEIHILGYYIDYENIDFQIELQKLRETRNLRNKLLIQRLNELGIEISLEEVGTKQKEKEGNVGRPHFAEVLIEKGIVASLEEAFAEYLGKEGKAYVTPPRILPETGVEFIQKYGGIPVLAHPGLYNCDSLIVYLVHRGLVGLEVFHPEHDIKDIDRYQAIANQYKLVATGGSDYHGIRNGQIFHGDMGSQPVSYQVVDQLNKRMGLKRTF